MERGRSDPVVAEPWRVRFKSAPQRSSEHLLTLLHEGETAIQYAAAMTLAGSGDSSFVPALLGWVVERQSCYSLRAISQVRDPRVLNTLLQFLPGLKDSPNLSRRGFERDLCLAIAQFGNGAIEKLAELLRLGSLPVQVRVLDILANIQTQEARTLILDWLNAFPVDQSNEHCQSVRKALDALARFKDPRVLDVLERLLEWKPDWIIEPLILLDHPAAWKMLEAFVRSGTNLHTRRHTLRQMAIADPRYKEESQRLAREAVAEGLRRAAALLLGVDWRQPLSDPLNRICEVLSDPNPKRRFQAISLICRHEAAAFPLDPVAALLDDTDAEVRANAVDALGLRGTERQIPAMQKLTHDPSGLVRYCAREALGKARQRKPS